MESAVPLEEEQEGKGVTMAKTANLRFIVLRPWYGLSTPIKENTRPYGLRAGTEQQCRDAQQGAPMRHDL